MSPEVTKPLPVPDDLSAGYWAAAAAGILTAGLYVVVPHLGYADQLQTSVEIIALGLIPATVEGGATVRSWTIVRDSFLPGFADDVPYVLVDAELDAQSNVRMIGRLVDGVDAPLAVGDRVTVTFDQLADGMAVPAFALETT